MVFHEKIDDMCFTWGWIAEKLSKEEILSVTYKKLKKALFKDSTSILTTWTSVASHNACLEPLAIAGLIPYIKSSDFFSYSLSNDQEVFNTIWFYISMNSTYNIFLIGILMI